MAMPEYTAASERLDHETFWERADASVRCTGLGIKLYMPRSDEALVGYFFIIDAKMFLDDNQQCTRIEIGIRTI
jgi:hypothetical protein